jgi:sugar phosphate isomerase/epimerase
LTQTIHRLHCIARVLGDNGIRLGLEWIGVEENHERDSLEGWQRFIWNMRQALDLVDDVCAPDENVGLVVDAFHWHVAGDTMDNLLALMPDQVVHVRICDAPDKPIRQLAETERLLPGDGHIDLRGFLEGLQHMHYRAFVAVEACGEDLGPGDSEQAAIRAGSSLNSMLESFHRWDDSVPAHLAMAHAGKDRAARA